MSFLLTTSESISNFMSIISDKWLEILGWISIPAVATALVVCSFKLITAIIGKKIGAKSIKPLANKVEELKGVVDGIEKKFNDKIEEYSNKMQDVYNKSFEKYSKAKQFAFAKMFEGEEKLKELAQQIESTKTELKAEAEEKVEEIKEEVSPVVEEVQQVIEEKVEQVENNTNYLLR